MIRVMTIEEFVKETQKKMDIKDYDELYKRAINYSAGLEELIDDLTAEIRQLKKDNEELYEANVNLSDDNEHLKQVIDYNEKKYTEEIDSYRKDIDYLCDRIDERDNDFEKGREAVLGLMKCIFE